MKKENADGRLLLVCVALPLLAGLLSGFLSRDGMQNFDGVIQPPLAPPAWLFPIVWTVLYAAMGVASWFVATAGAGRAGSAGRTATAGSAGRAIAAFKREALQLYGLQLAVNFFWPLLFFNRQQYLFSLIWLVLLWLLILWTIAKFFRISKPAAYLLVPYLLWVTFAGYLNYAIYVLN